MHGALGRVLTVPLKVVCGSLGLFFLLLPTQILPSFTLVAYFARIEQGSGLLLWGAWAGGKRHAEGGGGQTRYSLGVKLLN